MNGETLFRALSDVGDDLLHMAQTKKFANPWKKWGSLAAVLALVLCLSALVLPYFPMGCGSSQAPMEALPMDNVESQETAPEEIPEAAEEEMEAPAEDTAARSFRFEGASYVLEGEPVPLPENLGELLGTIEEASDDTLLGYTLFSIPDSENCYVKTEEGYLLAVREPSDPGTD